MAADTTPDGQAREGVAGTTTGSVFDTVVDRRNSNSMKWAYAQHLPAADEAAADPLPMWVADTDFKAPQAVIDALHQAVDHGVFGYPGGATDSYLDAVTGWQARRFGWAARPASARRWVGVVPAWAARP